MLEDLLMLARVEQEGESGEIAMRPVSVRNVIEAAVANCREMAQERGIALEVDCPGDLEAPLHETLMERALANLIDNAVHYSEPDRRIRIEAERSAGDLVLRVRDEGWGIPEEHLPRIFERFYRISKYRNQKKSGTGLGLAIVKHVAQAHRGRVDVESAAGRGSVFSIVIPPGARGSAASGGDSAGTAGLTEI
jgi:two-component system phosphate regulon sensor histidine kinase PhoR